MIAVPAGPAAGYPPVELRPGRRGGRGHLDRRPRARRRGHRGLPRRRRACGRSATSSTAAASARCSLRRLRVRSDLQPARSRRRRRHHLQARLERRPRAGRVHQRQLRSIAGRVGAGPPSIPLRVSAPRPGRPLHRAPLPAGRRAPAGPRRRAAAGGLARRRTGGRAADALVQPGHPLDVRALQGARAAPADRLLQPLLRGRGRHRATSRRPPPSSTPSIWLLCGIEAAESVSRSAAAVPAMCFCGARGPRRARPGQRIRVALTVQRRRGGRRTLDRAGARARLDQAGPAHPGAPRQRHGLGERGRPRSSCSSAP